MKQLASFPRDEPFIIEQAFGRFVHREFPVLIARVKQAKRQREKWIRT